MMSKDKYMQMQFLVDLCELENEDLNKEFPDIFEISQKAMKDLSKIEIYRLGFYDGRNRTIRHLKECLKEIRKTNKIEV